MVAAEGRRTRGPVGCGLSTGSTGLPTQLGTAPVACTRQWLLQYPSVGCRSRYSSYLEAPDYCSSIYYCSRRSYCSRRTAVGVRRRTTYAKGRSCVKSRRIVSIRCEKACRRATVYKNRRERASRTILRHSFLVRLGGTVAAQ